MKLFKGLEYLYFYFALVVFDLNLRLFGFPKMFKKYNKKYSQKVYYLTDELRVIERECVNLMQRIDKVCTYYPAEAKCLHRSFLAYRFLKKMYSLPINLVIGVKKFPFSAHAWIVYGNVSINETNDVTEGFQIILRSD